MLRVGSSWKDFETGFSNSGGIMFMAIGSRSRVEAAPLKIGASPSLLSGLEPEKLNVYLKEAAHFF